MTKFNVGTCFLTLFLITGCSDNQGKYSLFQTLPTSERSIVLFDDSWSFYRGDIAGAENPGFDDSDWRKVDLPHDWSIEDIPGTESPLDSAAIGGIDAGYFTGGTGWYRKSFFVPSALKGKTFIIHFEGIYMNSDVWFNGHYLSNHPYGYTSFLYDLSGLVRPGKTNILAVKVKNEGRNSRWYSGSGIYRHVWMIIKNQVHFPEWSVSVTTDAVTTEKADVYVSGKVINREMSDADLRIEINLYNPSGKQEFNAVHDIYIKKDSEEDFGIMLSVDKPDLWSPDNPALYSAVSEVYEKNEREHLLLKDRIVTTFGIRTFTVDSEKGFLLNGKPIKLKGGCVHHDNGPLGAAAFDRAEERRVQLLKASGFNAIRCAHNPPSPAFLDACDRYGMLVIDEAFDMWREQKNPDDYHRWFDEWWKKDIESMVLRDRNHPSVIMWSIGNEVPERGKPEGAELAHEIAEYVKELDPTRPVTSAVNSVTPDKDPYFSALDICGYNYAVEKYVSDHKRLPERIIFGSESFPFEAYDYWMATLKNPWVIGDFVWTAFDYLGEVSIGWMGYPHKGSFYPWNHAYCGDIDICGFKRPQSFYRDALWNEKKTVSVFVKPPVPSFLPNPDRAEWSKWHWEDVVASWNWKGYEGKPLKVIVYSNCDETELILNGRSIGKKKTGRENRFNATWEVPYDPGTITAKGYTGSIAVASSELKTAGDPVKINLSPDRTEIKSGRQDLSYVTVELVDINGIRNPSTDNLVKFYIEGPGEIISVGSSNPMSTESYKRPQRKAWQGRCMVIVRSGNDSGIIKLRAESEGLEACEVEIKCIGTE